MQGFGWSIIIAIVILFGSHLSVDRDFSDGAKGMSIGFMALFAVIYVVFGIF